MFGGMCVKLCVVEVVDQDGKIAALKQLAKVFDLDLPVRIHQGSRILLARDQRGKASVGILVFTERKALSRVCIEWVYVNKLWRNLSVGRSLIDYLERDCMHKRVSVIEVMFDQQNNGMNGLVSRVHGWNTSRFLDAYTFSAKKALVPALARGEAVMKRRSLQACIVPLSECNDEDLLQAAQAKNLPQWAQIDQLLLNEASRKWSRVFYLKGRIVGWLMVFMLAAETLDYRSLWLDQEHRHTGIMVKALAEVMRAAHLQEGSRGSQESGESCCPWGKGFFLVSRDNQQMISWVNKRLTQGMYQKSSLVVKEKLVATEAAVCI